MAPEESEEMLWLRYASEDLRTARLLLGAPEIAPRETCAVAQQAGEKAIKAVLIQEATIVPRTHALEDVRRLLGAPFLPQVSDTDLEKLSSWAIAGRYPGDWEEATASDAADALALAEIVVAAAEERIAPPEAGRR